MVVVTGLGLTDAETAMVGAESASTWLKVEVLSVEPEPLARASPPLEVVFRARLAEPAVVQVVPLTE